MRVNNIIAVHVINNSVTVQIDESMSNVGYIMLHVTDVG